MGKKKRNKKDDTDNKGGQHTLTSSGITLKKFDNELSVVGNESLDKMELRIKRLSKEYFPKSDSYNKADYIG